MGKMEYLDALKRAMTGLPPETQAKTLAYYEQRFVDGVAAGRSEQDIGRELDDPKKIAMTLRASAHLVAFNEKKNPANLLRLTVSAAGLAIFNLFMVVPAAVCAGLLAALYGCALAFYLGGIAITACGLAGTNQLVLDKPLRHVAGDTDGARRPAQTRVAIGPNGILVDQDPASSADDEERGSRVIRGAEKVAGTRIEVVSGMDEESRTAQTLVGIGMVLGGIVLFLLSLVVTRYTLIGIKRYVQMNLSLLKGS